MIHTTSYPTKLCPRCGDHLEQILNTFNMEIIHHLVLATESLLRDVQNKRLLTALPPNLCVCVCVLPSHRSERLAYGHTSRSHTCYLVPNMKEYSAISVCISHQTNLTLAHPLSQL